MAVNTLATGLIVFKILRVFLEVKATVTSVERTLGSTGGTKLRQIIFIIIESGIVLFAIQLVRIVLYILGLEGVQSYNSQVQISSYFVIGIHQMFNVIIKSVHFYCFCFTDNICLATRASHQHWFWCGSRWNCPSMTKNPSKVFVLILPQVIRLHIGEWKIVVCRPRARTPSRRGVKLLNLSVHVTRNEAYFAFLNPISMHSWSDRCGWWKLVGSFNIYSYCRLYHLMQAHVPTTLRSEI